MLKKKKKKKKKDWPWGKRNVGQTDGARGVVWPGYLEGLGREEMDGCLRGEIALGSITAYILKNCDKQFRNVSYWWSSVDLQLCSMALAVISAVYCVSRMLPLHWSRQCCSVAGKRGKTQGRNRGNGENCTVWICTSSNKISAGQKERDRQKDRQEEDRKSVV